MIIIRPELVRILDIIEDLSQKDVKKVWLWDVTEKGLQELSRRPSR